NTHARLPSLCQWASLTSSRGMSYVLRSRQIEQMSEIAVEYRRDRECVNTHRPLTHSLDYGKEQAVKQHTGEIGKVCTKCNEDKPFSEYNKRKSSKDGHYNDCKSCQS